MKHKLLTCLFLASLFFLSASFASADTFSFTLSAPLLGYNGTGTLTATALGNGSYRVTNATGTNILGLLAAGTYNSNDDLLFPSATQTLDTHGLALSMIYGSDIYQADLFSSATGYFGQFTTPQAITTIVPISFTMSAAQASPATQVMAPEPKSLILLGTGMMATALLALRHAARKDQFRAAPSPH